MRSIHVVGLVLWRGGLLVAAGAALFLAARWLLRYVDLPFQLELGAAMVALGLALVLVSLVIERVHALSDEDLAE